MQRKFRMAAIAAIFAAAAPMPAQSQIVMTPWEECVLQCLQDYGGGTALYRLCRENCTRIHGGPQLVQIELPGKRD